MLLLRPGVRAAPRRASTLSTLATKTRPVAPPSPALSSRDASLLRRTARRPTARTTSRPRALCFSHAAAAAAPPPPAASPSPSPSSSSSPPPPQDDAAAATSAPPPPPPLDASSAPATLYGYFPSTLPAGPPPAGHFPIDTSLLRREFLRLQSAHHPDKQPAHLKPQAEALSAAINHAYRTLANPLLRAQYLLALRGVDVAADESLKVEEPGLLASVLDAHEAVEDARHPADLDPLRGENESRIRRSERTLEAAFRCDDVGAAKKEAVRLRYWVNIRESIHHWEEGHPTVLHH